MGCGASKAAEAAADPANAVNAVSNSKERPSSRETSTSSAKGNGKSLRDRKKDGDKYSPEADLSTTGPQTSGGEEYDPFAADSEEDEEDCSQQ